MPSRVEPESLKRSSQQDPFLEFDSERPSISGLLKPTDFNEMLKPSAAAPDDEPRRPIINPTLVFALAVGGVVFAIVGYYQMSRVLANRARPQVTAVQQATEKVAQLAVPAFGRLEISSEPTGAGVTVDGRPWGSTPLTLQNIPSGPHTVVITRDGASVTKLVDLTAGGSALVTAVLAGSGSGATATPATAPIAAAPIAGGGWVTFEAPIQLLIFEQGRQRGTTRAGRLPLPDGTHTLELVNDLYEVRQTVSARVLAGRGARVVVPMPTGQLSINATPWADAWVDGSPVGTTPLANLNLAVGSHEVLLRHPTLGQHRETVIVKAVTPARLGVDLRRK